MNRPRPDQFVNLRQRLGLVVDEVPYHSPSNGLASLAEVVFLDSWAHLKYYNVNWHPEAVTAVMVISSLILDTDELRSGGSRRFL